MVVPDEHVALVKGPIDPEQPTLVRVQSAKVARDVFGIAGAYPDTGPVPATWLKIAATASADAGRMAAAAVSMGITVTARLR